MSIIVSFLAIYLGHIKVTLATIFAYQTKYYLNETKKRKKKKKEKKKKMQMPFQQIIVHRSM